MMDKLMEMAKAFISCSKIRIIDESRPIVTYFDKIEEEILEYKITLVNKIDEVLINIFNLIFIFFYNIENIIISKLDEIYIEYNIKLIHIDTNVIYNYNSFKKAKIILSG